MCVCVCVLDGGGGKGVGERESKYEREREKWNGMEWSRRAGVGAIITSALGARRRSVLVSIAQAHRPENDQTTPTESQEEVGLLCILARAHAFSQAGTALSVHGLVMCPARTLLDPSA